jgi:RimJ/RimL family protein N-acetyltransferase
MKQQELTFRPIAESDISLVEEWLEDPESKKCFGGMIPFRPYFEYQQTRPWYYVWMIYHGGTPVALAGFEIREDGSAAVLFLVCPNQRGRGYGSCVLKALASVPEAQSVRVFVAPVEPDNQAAISCLEAAGYKSMGTDPDDNDFLRYTLKPTMQPVRH